MSPRGPIKGTSQAVAMDNVLASWPMPPDWVLTLAKACDAPGASQVTVAKRVGYSSSTISQVLFNKYDGVVSNVEQAVRGALMAETVNCPVVGEIKRNLCIEHQKRAKKFNPTSGMRVQLYRACRRTCEHSSIRGEANVE